MGHSPNSLRLVNFVPGMYLLRIEMGAERVSRSLVVTRGTGQRVLPIKFVGSISRHGDKLDRWTFLVGPKFVECITFTAHKSWALLLAYN